MSEDLVDDDNADTHQGTNPHESPVKRPAEDASRQRGNKGSLWGLQSVRTSTGGTLETKGALHELHDGRDDRRTKNNSDDQRNLLFPRRRTNQLTSLEVLQVVIRDRRDTKDDGCGKQGIGHQLNRLTTTNSTIGEFDEESSHQDDQDANAGNRAIGCTDETSHVTAHRSNSQTDEQDERQADDDDAGHGPRYNHVASKSPQHETDRDHRDQHHGEDNRNR